MHVRRRAFRAHGRAAQRGVAAVETAVVLPLVVALILGAVDLGQYANCHQKISDACREGARFAAKFETTDASQVETAVLACLADMFPNVSTSTLQSATSITVRNADGTAVSGTALGSIATGNPVNVEVTLQFDSVRWVNGPQFLGNRTIQAATVMRRE